MESHLWITYLLACCAIATLPGPGAVLAMSHGASYGVRKASATILGQELGLAFILVVAGVGVGSVLCASAWAFFAVKCAGALYLIYVGFSQWRSQGGSVQRSASTAVPVSWRKRCGTGLLTNATNPKGIMFMVAVLPQFIVATQPLLPQLAVLTATMCVVDAIVMHGYAYGASAVGGLLKNTRIARVQNRLFGTLLIAAGTALLFIRRNA